MIINIMEMKGGIIMANTRFNKTKIVEILKTFLSKEFFDPNYRHFIEECVVGIINAHGIKEVTGFSGGWLSTDGTAYMSIFYDDKELLFIDMSLREHDNGNTLLSYCMQHDTKLNTGNDMSTIVNALYNHRRGCIQDLHVDEDFTPIEIAEMLRSDLTAISMIAVAYDLCEMYNIDQDCVDSFTFGRSSVHGIPYIIMNTTDHDTIFVSESRIVDGDVVKGRAESCASSDEAKSLSWVKHLEDGDIDAVIQLLS